MAVENIGEQQRMLRMKFYVTVVNTLDWAVVNFYVACLVIRT